jgi:Zn-dependent protease with chaperone function
VNFFERQSHVRKMSARLVVLFVIAVIAIVAVVDLAVLLAFHRTYMSTGQTIATVIATSVITVLAITLAASFRTLGLRGGGGVVARELGGVLVPQDTQDPQLRRLRNVVEEIAIASGTPVPEIYVMPHEKGINAFAAGWSTSDAAVSVTQGALDSLNRAELQGVIGHEFSHVVNGDMRLNIRLIGLLFGILFLAVIGRTLTYGGLLGGGGGRRDNRNGNNGNPLVIIGIALLAVGFIGVIAGRFIKAAVSRQREYLADASAVQYTRQTSGIVGALAKIAGLEQGSQLRNPKREEVGHMLFGSGASLSSLLATHPPLEERIKVLDPSYDLNRLPQLARQWAAHPPVGLEEDAQLGLAPATVSAPAAAASAPAAPLPAPHTTVPVAEHDVLRGVGAPDHGAYAKAEALINQIPADVLDRARNPRTVVPLVLGLLMADDPAARTDQHTMLAQRYGQPLADAVWNEGSALAGLHPLLKLPLAELAFPALKQRSLAERSTVVKQVSDLIHADGIITAHEYCLSRLVYSELGASIQPPSQWRTGGGRLTGARDAVVTLLSVVAFAGNEDPQAAAHAYRAGLERVLPGLNAPYQPPTDGVTVLETAWPALTTLSPGDTQHLVAGVVAVISDDGVTTVTEMELLRTICGLLHCPLPL